MVDRFEVHIISSSPEPSYDFYSFSEPFTKLVLWIDNKGSSFVQSTMWASRGVVGDKWSQRILWICAVGTAVSLYFVAVERQAQNRQRALAEGLNALDSKSSGEGA